eukprot:scaffold1280_cov246-Pinguiococcus_pyrenoidosus.AAC.4
MVRKLRSGSSADFTPSGWRGGGHRKSLRTDFLRLGNESGSAAPSTRKRRPAHFGGRAEKCRARSLGARLSGLAALYGERRGSERPSFREDPHL